MKGNIPYFDCYHVTREGNVYSKYRDRVTWRKMAKRKKNNGYLIVSLRNNKGIKYTFNIPSPKLSEKSINKMIEDYESGMSNLQIKVKYGISIMTMYKYFSERGVIWKKGKR